MVEEPKRVTENDDQINLLDGRLCGTLHIQCMMAS